MPASVRLAVDIGGTFTDVVLEHGERRYTTKVLTTPRAPEEGMLAGTLDVLREARLAPSAVEVVIHGTTLATNALIERKGARVAFVTTAGFKDVLETAYEKRYEHYDVYLDMPSPLVPRRLRLPVSERVSAAGKVLVALDEASVAAVAQTIERAAVESIAIGFLHSYANPTHEQRTAELLARRFPGVPISLSSAVSPEIREYERFSTTVANAYVRPLMASYLTRLADRMGSLGMHAPLYLVTSGGGLTTLETARRFPIRLVESGPAGGAILAGRIATECGLRDVLSFDMGGTTAKICFLTDGVPEHSRRFEIARVYRNLKGSGLPVRIPVTEMVEIGAGGGSIARVDRLKRIAVGPDSAGAEPGPACYGLGGTKPTVTDANVALGRIAPQGFAGGRMTLDAVASSRAIAQEVGAPLGLEASWAASGVCEMVEENMANAARVHAIERAKTVSDCVMIAFGGGAPLHAARLAEKLGMTRVIIPTGASVGSAIGFLRAPVSYELARSLYMVDSSIDLAAVNALLLAMSDEARRIVTPGARSAPLEEYRSVDVRYVGQGHELAVPLPGRPIDAGDVVALHAAFEERYRAQYGLTIPGLALELLTWTVTVTTRVEPPPRMSAAPARHAATADVRRRIFDAAAGDWIDVPVYDRDRLAPGAALDGPALVAEPQTTTLVPRGFAAQVNALGYIELARRQPTLESRT
jgi:N-methylhydantoinase A